MPVLFQKPLKMANCSVFWLVQPFLVFTFYTFWDNMK